MAANNIASLRNIVSCLSSGICEHGVNYGDPGLTLLPYSRPVRVDVSTSRRTSR